MMDKWSYKKLGEYVKVNGGNAFKSNEYQDVGTPLLRISNIKDHLIDLTDCIYVSDDFIDTHKQYLLDEGDIVIAMSGATTGKTGVVRKENLPLLLNQRVGVFNIKDKTSIFETFLQYVVESFYFQNILQIDAIGGAQPNISPKQIESINIYVPPIQEQQKIAAILSSVDEAIEKTEQIIEQTETVKKGLMQELLTKGIGHTEFDDTVFGLTPKSWEIVKLSDIFTRIREVNDFKKDYPVLTITAKEGLINQLERFNRVIAGSSLKKYIKLRKGQFAYNRGNSKTYPYGAIYMQNGYDEALVPFVYYCFDKKNDVEIDTDFYQYIFHSTLLNRQLRRVITSSARQDGLMNISFDDFFKTQVVLPPIKEQKRIKTILQNKDDKIKIEELKLKQLQNIKTGLMQELLTGKKRVKVDGSEEVLA